jgi:hypothetical protein
MWTTRSRQGPLRGEGPTGGSQLFRLTAEGCVDRLHKWQAGRADRYPQDLDVCS